MAESTDAAPGPQTIVSENGVLDTTLEAGSRKISIDGAPVDAMVYNGSYPGPVPPVRPGDLMRIVLVNRLNEPTNLHFHGVQTSPLGTGDNVLTTVRPGESFRYDIRIPIDRPPGLYWYHAHVHGLATRQIEGGLSGALVVEGLEAELPISRGTIERLFVLKDVEYDDATGNSFVDDELHGLLQTIDGRTHLDATMRPGETQFWRFGNQSANLYFHLRLRDHRFRIVAEDGVRLRAPRDVETLDLAPAARAEVLVDSGPVGDYEIVSEKVLTGTAMSRTLGTLHVTGPTMAAAASAEPPPWVLEDPRKRTVTARRMVVFTQNDEAETYRINGRLFEHGRIDTRVPFGSTEEWTVRNDTDDMHVFHIHQLSFQVVAVNGEVRPFDGYLDTVRVPERGSVTPPMPFTRRETIGAFVYHCHVLKHEDNGMMAAIEVYDPAASSGPWRFLDFPIRWPRQRWHAARSGLPFEYCGL